MEMSSCIPEPAHSLIPETQAGKASARRTGVKVMHLHLVHICPCATPAASWSQGICHRIPVEQEGHTGSRGTPFVLLLHPLYCCWSRGTTQHQAAQPAGTQVLRETS